MRLVTPCSTDSGVFSQDAHIDAIRMRRERFERRRGAGDAVKEKGAPGPEMRFSAFGQEKLGGVQGLLFTVKPGWRDTKLTPKQYRYIEVS
jgi:hypothetical protein